MTTAKLRPAELPDWPRLMGREQAAAYLSVSPNMLDDIPVRRVRINSRILWDRLSLDDFASRLAQEAGAAPPDAMHLLDKLAAAPHAARQSSPTRAKAENRPQRQGRAPA